MGNGKYGNTYFVKKSNSPKNNYRERRFVSYRGIVEASKVPQCWNAWLHHVVKEPPVTDQRKPEWIKEHTSNLTGSPYSYEYTFEKNKKKNQKMIRFGALMNKYLVFLGFLFLFIIDLC